MMYTVEKTVNALKKKALEALENHETEFTVTLKCNGDKVTIAMCGTGDVKVFSDIKYYLVYGRFPWAGSNKLEDVAELLNNWEEKILESEDEKLSLRKYYEENKDKPRDLWFGFYSDWHKDVYGYRPR